MSSDIKNQKHAIDASGKILGRLAVEVANILRGKGKPGFLRHKDTGESVIVFNTDKIKVTGKKMIQKKYHSYSGYPGGLKSRRLEEMMERDSRKVVWSAVFGMMPKNRLSNQIIRKLELYKGEVK